MPVGHGGSRVGRPALRRRRPRLRHHDRRVIRRLPAPHRVHRPQGINSGVYNRGLFEIQVFDSFGKPKLGFHDCGSLYERAYPRENLSKPPGEWQTYDITLKGKKLTLVWNGKTVYKDHDVRYGETDREAFNRLNQENAGKPAELRVKLREEAAGTSAISAKGGTRASLDGPDRPGPILLQGDHGPVAYRNIFIRTLPSSNRFSAPRGSVNEIHAGLRPDGSGRGAPGGSRRRAAGDQATSRRSMIPRRPSPRRSRSRSARLALASARRGAKGCLHPDLRHHAARAQPDDPAADAPGVCAKPAFRESAP